MTIYFCKFQHNSRFPPFVYAIIDDDFEGMDCMKFDKLNWNKQLKSIINLFVNKKAAKKVRITYQIVWNLALLFMIVGLLGAAFAGGLGAGYFASLVKDEPIR